MFFTHRNHPYIIIPYPPTEEGRLQLWILDMCQRTARTGWSWSWTGTFTKSWWQPLLSTNRILFPNTPRMDIYHYVPKWPWEPARCRHTCQTTGVFGINWYFCCLPPGVPSKDWGVHFDVGKYVRLMMDPNQNTKKENKGAIDLQLWPASTQHSTSTVHRSVESQSN